MAYNRKDFYFKQAKKKNFAARSIFKLEEIDRRLRILKKGTKVLDLGCAPGSWSQYCVKAVGPEGFVLGVDLQAVKLTFPNAKFIQADLNDLDLKMAREEAGIKGAFDTIVSDMAPKTTGIKFTDQARSVALCELAVSVSDRMLRTGGHLVVKLFHGADFQDFKKLLDSKFRKTEVIRPKSTRKESKEIFLIGMFKLDPPTDSDKD